VTTPNGVATPSDEPTLPDVLAQLAAVTAVETTVTDRKFKLRDEVARRFLADPNKAKSVTAEFPGVGEVGTATRKKTSPVVRVVDERAYTDDVELHHPTEVERTLVIELPTGFGSDAARDAVLEALAPLIEAGQILGVPREERKVREAFRKKHLAKNANLATGKLEEPDEATGVFREVAGVVVTQPPATGEFVFSGFDADRQAAVRRRLAEDAAALAAVIGARPAQVTDSKVIAGEAEDVEVTL
jgi:hypothetical protein